MPDSLGPEDALVEVLTLGRKPTGAEPEVVVVRALEESDLPALANAPTVEGTGAGSVIKAIGHQHHRLAQLVAKGLSNVDISADSGYSPGYISSLKTDQSFAELVEYYVDQERELAVDGLKRLAAVGVTATEELARRLEDKPQGFANRELMELAELGLSPRPGGNSSGGSSGPQVSVAVQFVQPSAAELPGRKGLELEGEVVRNE